jgi:hypothetical protein
MVLTNLKEKKGLKNSLFFICSFMKFVVGFFQVFGIAAPDQQFFDFEVFKKTELHVP